MGTAEQVVHALQRLAHACEDCPLSFSPAGQLLTEHGTLHDSGDGVRPARIASSLHACRWASLGGFGHVTLLVCMLTNEPAALHAIHIADKCAAGGVVSNVALGFFRGPGVWLGLQKCVGQLPARVNVDLRRFNAKGAYRGVARHCHVGGARASSATPLCRIALCSYYLVA